MTIEDTDFTGLDGVLVYYSSDLSGASCKPECTAGCSLLNERTSRSRLTLRDLAYSMIDAVLC